MGFRICTDRRIFLLPWALDAVVTIELETPGPFLAHARPLLTLLYVLNQPDMYCACYG